MRVRLFLFQVMNSIGWHRIHQDHVQRVLATWQFGQVVGWSHHVIDKYNQHHNHQLRDDSNEPLDQIVT